jgi:hypothetical protein
MVADLTRAGLDARLLLYHRAKPDMHLEVPHTEHGRLTDGAYAPRAVSRDEPGLTQVTNLDMRGPRSRPQFLRLVNISGGLFGARIFDTLFNTIDTICGI